MKQVFSNNTIPESSSAVRASFFRKLSLGVVAVLLLFVPAINAQLAGKGTIRGTVTDATGATVPGATVVITSVETNVKQTLISTGAGDYSVSVDPSKYTVAVSMPGFKNFVQQNVNVNALQEFQVNVVLQTGDVSESVTVTDSPPALEVSNATLGVTMEQEMYAALPVIQDGGGQRRATDFASLLPGVSAGTSNGNLTTNAGVVNGGGSRGAVSSIYINGVPITSAAGQGDPRFVWTSMAVDAIEQFQVQTVGYSAIYEGQGVQNYTVKRGTNKLHGVFYDYVRNTAFDTWGFAAPSVLINGKTVKPTENQNEYGAFFSFPVLKDKLFVFGGYEGYRFSRLAPQSQGTVPTLLMRGGDFTEAGANQPIYDPDTTTYCPTCGTGTQAGKAAYARTQFQGLKNGIPTLNVVPQSRISAVANNLQRFLPAPTNSAVSNNYTSNYHTGLNNWTTTNRVDYSISSRHTISGVIAFGRQATTAPSATSFSSSASALPIPYISSQQFSPKTKVILFEDVYTISPRIVNQFKYGYGRYDGPGYNQSIGAGYGAAENGIAGLPSGQAQTSFPKVTFSGGTVLPNQWAGYSSNRPVASGYVLVDNVQWTLGKHALTIGGQIAWMQYNYLVNATGVNPLQLTFSNATTAGYNGSTTAVTGQGQAYASYLIGATNSASFTQSAVPETGGRFRPISPYIQDNWKVNSKLTLDIGLRYDYYPTYKEVKDRFSYLDPNKTNTLVGIPGALAFGGSAGCNCRQPVNDFLKNFGPRVGFAYTADPKTVIRGSYAIIYTHGNANGGSATSRQGSGLAGYSVSPVPTTGQPSAVGQKGSIYYKLDNPFPSYTLPPTLDPTLGTANTTATSAASQNPSYADPYYGGRAPQFINWSFGLQREITSNMTFTMSYVGSQGHFLQPDSLAGRGKWANQLDPVYLSLGKQLSDQAALPAGLADLASIGKGLPYPTFGGTSTPSVAQALKPFPQYNGVSDAYGFIGNTRYHALQVYMQQRMAHGLTFMTNYTWSRAIDNNGTFRSGYDIPAAYATDGQFHKARSLDKSLSLGDQRHKFVITGAYDLPFGKGELGGSHFITRALFGGYKLSTIFQAYSGSPLAITAASCNTNPSQSACEPIRNPNYVGDGKKAGTLPFTYANLSNQQFLDPAAFAVTPDYKFSTLARTAAYSGLFQPGNYKLDMSLRRSFGIPTGGFHEGTKLVIQADMFNVTNHTHFVYSQSSSQPLTNWSATSTSYGQLVVDAGAATNRAVQIAARLEF